MSLLSSSRLFDLFSGKSEERSFLDLVFTVNKLVWALGLIKWINFEVWWYCGGGSFAWNICA